MIEYRVINGPIPNNYIEIISKFRSTQFEAPPYSYAYDTELENNYLLEYSNCLYSICINNPTRQLLLYI